MSSRNSGNYRRCGNDETKPLTKDDAVALAEFCGRLTGLAHPSTSWAIASLIIDESMNDAGPIGAAWRALTHDEFYAAARRGFEQTGPIRVTGGRRGQHD